MCEEFQMWKPIFYISLSLEMHHCLKKKPEPKTPLVQLQKGFRNENPIF